MAAYSLKSLELAAARFGFKVLDYDAWSNDTSLFSDSVHLNRSGAEQFSEAFFADLERFVVSEPKDFSYERRRR